MNAKIVKKIITSDRDRTKSDEKGTDFSGADLTGVIWINGERYNDK